MAYEHGNDLCLSFWAMAMEQGWITFPSNAQVLEIGCAEADWQTPMLALRPDLQITGLDWRDCQRPGKFVRGDVIQSALFERDTFDCVVSVSAIEHVGLGAYDGDPQNERGDILAMYNACRWLKPGGWMYLDVPYREVYEAHPRFRAYDEIAITTRLVVGQFTKKYWATCKADHPDAPYMALLLEKV